MWNLKGISILQSNKETVNEDTFIDMQSEDVNVPVEILLFGLQEVHGVFNGLSHQDADVKRVL